MPADAAVRERPEFRCATLEGDRCLAYTVQGAVPRLVLLPESEGEAVAALAACDAARLAVAPWGGGTQQEVGYPPERLDAVLSLEHLDRIVEYEPADLTVSVQAGCTIGGLLRALAEHGQMLPFDAAAPGRATVGGALATNLAGPRRFGGGSYRDLLIGLTVAAPDGTVSKAGGMVVKNVSGYDLMKLYLGALGTLGVLLRANFKVLTRPAVEWTAVIDGERDALIRLASALAASQLGPTAIELVGPGVQPEAPARWCLGVLLSGSARGVERQRRDVAAMAEGHGPVEWLDREAMSAWWSRCTEFLAPLAAGPEEALLRLVVVPADLGPLFDDLEVRGAALGLRARLVAHAGNGMVFARVTGRDLPRALPDFWQALAARWGNATVLAAPTALKAELELWGPQPAGFALMRRIKEQFDPHRTLNPGRFVGRL